MSFCEMLEILKERNAGRIVLCNNGNFYTAIGNDAIALNKALGLKLSCMKTGLCKVGFPINALEKYTGLLIETGYSFIIYDFNSEKEEITIIISCLGIRLNWEIEKNKCFSCEKFKNKKLDKYTNAIIKMRKREEEEESEFKEIEEDEE